MTAILITGGAGYIGAHVALAALDAGREVVVLDDLSTGFRQAVPAGAAFAEGDIRDVATLVRLLRNHSVGAVVHMAALTVVPQSVARPLDYYAANLAGALALAQACVEAGVGRLVFSSTAAVYGDASPRVDERSPTRPASPYGRTKLMAEALLADAAAAHGLKAAALRYFNVAGADPAGRAGQSTAQATHLFKAACQAALGRRPALTVFGDDWPTRDGTGVRDFVHVRDVAAAHLLALDRLEAADAPGLEVFNLGSEQGCSVREAAAAVGAAAGRPVPMALAPRRPGDLAELTADASRARAVLGWRPTLGLHDIARDALAWERTLPA